MKDFHSPQRFACTYTVSCAVVLCLLWPLGAVVINALTFLGWAALQLVTFLSRWKPRADAEAPFTMRKCGELKTSCPLHQFVSVHLPIHNEPPDVVRGTLNALAQLQYPAVEIIVIDNNTRDPALWRSEAASAEQDVVIIINSPKLMAMWRRQDSNCQIFLWRHNFLSNRHRLLMDTLVEYDATMVCVSRYHQIDSRRAQRRYSSPARTVVIPNPVQVYRHGHVHRNLDHLLFCSSPHKGLEEVIERFLEARQGIPTLQLRICNPGYLSDPQVKESGIEVLGSLPRPQLHAEMASALCVFYPQTRFRETFGLVGAEANALGTPVLAPAGLGGLAEVLDGDGQLLRSVDTLGIVRQLKRWRRGQLPFVSSRAEFDPIAVSKCWMSMICRFAADKSVRNRSVYTNGTLE